MAATRTSTSPASTHPATTVGPVHLRVADLALARRFYTSILGLRAQDDVGELVLTADGATPLLRIQEDRDASARDPRTTGLYHFALLVPTRAEWGHTLRHLSKTEYALDGIVDHTVSEALYLTDPEGNGIEIASDFPRGKWAHLWTPQARDRVGIMNKPVDFRAVWAATDAAPRAWDGLAAGTRMGHVHLHVRDVREAVGFYTDVLGFDTMIDIGSAAFVSAGGYHHHLGLNVWAGPRPPKPHAVGLRHFTIEYPNDAERDRILSRVREAGAPVEDTPEGPIVTDPTGNRVILRVSA